MSAAAAAATVVVASSVLRMRTYVVWRCRVELLMRTQYRAVVKVYRRKA